MSTQDIRVLVKQDYSPVTITGYTNTVLIGSGATTVNNISGGTWIVASTMSGATSWGDIVGTITNQTDLIEYISGQTSGLTSSWSGLTGLPSDNSDLVDYVSESISAATSGLTSSWSGLTGSPTDNSDLVDLLSGYSLTSHTHTQYVTNTDFNVYSGDTYDYLTGLTDSGIILQGIVNDLEAAFTGHTGNTSIHFPFSDVTDAISAATSGLTSSWTTLEDKPAWLSGETLEEFQTGHTHSYNNLTDLPSLFSGDYDDLTNKPDLSVYLTGVTWNIITGDISGNTTLQNALDAKLEIDDFNTYSGLTHNEITGLTSTVASHTGDTDIHYAQSAITLNQSQVTDLVTDLAAKVDDSTFTGHTGDTTIHFTKSSINLDDLGDVDTTTPADNDIIKYSGSTWVNEAPLDIFANVDDLEYLRRNGTEITGVTTVDILANVSDGQLLARNGTDITGVTNSFASASDLTGLTASFNTYTGDTDSAISGINDDIAYLSGQTGLKLDVTIYETYTGNTATALAAKVDDSTFSGYTGTTAPAAFASKVKTIKSVTGTSYTLIESDNDKVLLFNMSDAADLYLPSGLTVGFNCDIVRVSGSDYVDFNAGSGATVRKITGKFQGYVGKIILAETNVWYVGADLIA